MSRYKMTPECLEQARRLKNLWDIKKSDLGLTQETAAKQLGFARQSTVSQYLNALIPLNTEAVLKFAKLLEIKPTDIDPGLGKLLVDTSKLFEKRQVPVIGALIGTAPDGIFIEVPLEEGKNMYAVLVDTDQVLGIAQGDHLICNPEEYPVPGDRCVARLSSGQYELVEMIHADKTGFTFTNLITGDKYLRSLDEIIQVDPVVSIHAARRDRPRRLHPKVVNR